MDISQVRSGLDRGWFIRLTTAKKKAADPAAHQDACKRFDPADQATVPPPATEPAKRTPDDMFPAAASPEPLQIVAGLATLAAASLLAALRNARRAS